MQLPLIILILSLTIIFTEINSQNNQDYNGGNYFDGDDEDGGGYFSRRTDKCIDSMGTPQACYAPFMMLSAGRNVEATNTCGSYRNPEKYCYVLPNESPNFQCDRCNINDFYKNSITDKNPNTWWQSQTLHTNKTIHFKESVNLTINLGAKMHLAYLMLQFKNQLPRAMVIHKRSNESEEWQPWAYYSNDCLNNFNMEADNHYENIQPFNKITCSESAHFKQDNQILFLVTKYRIDPENFYLNEDFKDWASAKEVKIELKKMYTMGDEKNAEDDTLHMYYFSVAQLSIGGRCDCNGHGSKCRDSTGSGIAHMVCECQHNTEGDNCERCKAGYQNVPWKPADRNSPFECKQCQCNGNADICRFDEDLYKETGSGGVCVDCKYNTEGKNCEKCLPGHFPDPNHPGRCIKCECNQLGTMDQNGEVACNENDGQCPCKPGVAGRQCDTCAKGYYSMTSAGCKSCDCSVEGTLGNNKSCDPITGKCQCKEFVTGEKCDMCKLGSFGLVKNDPLGCKPCNCSDLASTCEINQEKINEYASTELADLNELAEADRYIINCPVGKQKCKICKNENGEPNIPCRPNDKGFYECLCVDDVNNCPFCDKGLFELQEDFRMEICKCPEKYTGDNCDKCIEGYRRDPPGGPPNSVCVPCTCNGHADTCDPISGQCQCRDFTGGLFCDRCEDGYYSNSVIVQGGAGSQLNCKPCPCPEGTKCQQLATEVVCLDCPNNRSGKRCEKCSPNFFGSPMEGKECKPCECNGNTNLDDEGNCNDVTGKCMNCQFGTAGDHCEKCRPGYKQNYKKISPDNPEAVTLIDETGLSVYVKKIRGCSPCNCDPIGSLRGVNNEFSCVEKTGKCACKTGVEGLRCDRCKIGYYGFNSGNGCKPCECNIKGSKSEQCDGNTGQCPCSPNVIGQRCDSCAKGYWKMTPLIGCQECSCNYYGSMNQICDPISGKCECRPFANGLKCDKCKENHYNLEQGCIPCDSCFNLIQNGVNDVRKNLNDFMNSNSTLNGEDPKVLEEIKENLSKIKTEITQQYSDAVEKIGSTTMIVDEKQFKKFVDSMDMITQELDAKLQKSQAYRPVCDYSNFGKELADFIDAKERLKTTLDEINKQVNDLPTDEIENFSTPAQNLFQKARNLNNMMRFSRSEEKFSSLQKKVDELSSREAKLLNDLKEVEKNQDKLEKIDSIGVQLKELEEMYNSLNEYNNATKENYDTTSIKLEKIKALIQGNEVNNKQDIDYVKNQFDRLKGIYDQVKDKTETAKELTMSAIENKEKLNNFTEHIQSSKAMEQEKISNLDVYQNQMSSLTKGDDNQLSKAVDIYQKAERKLDYFNFVNNSASNSMTRMADVTAAFEEFKGNLAKESDIIERMADEPSDSLIEFNKIKDDEGNLKIITEKNSKIQEYLEEKERLKTNTNNLIASLNNQGQPDQFYRISNEFRDLEKTKQDLIRQVVEKKEALKLILEQNDFLARELEEFQQHERHLKLVLDKMVQLKSSTSSIFMSKMPETNK